MAIAATSRLFVIVRILLFAAFCGLLQRGNCLDVEKPGKPRLLLHADFDGNADLDSAAAGQRAGRLLPVARFVAGRNGSGRALTSDAAPPPHSAPPFPLEFFGLADAATSRATDSTMISPDADLSRVIPSDGSRLKASTPAAMLPLEGNYLPAAGTLCFWFQPRQRMGRTAGLMFDLVSSTGDHGPSIGYGSARGEVVLRPTMLSAGLSADDATCTFKHLEGGKWYHFAFTWDASTQEIAGWLYGRKFSDGRMHTTDTLGAVARELAVGCREFAIDDLRIYDRALSSMQIQEVAQLNPADRLDQEALVIPHGSLDVEALRGRMLYHNDFATSTSLADWVMEGAGRAEIVDGRLSLGTTRSGPQKFLGHLVYWNSRDFPADLIAEWEFTPTRSGGLCIVFFAAAGRHGESIFDPSLPSRDGIFDRYYAGAINCYHISYYRHSGNLQPECNLRKNYGFHLLEIGPDYTSPEPGRVNRITLVKQGGRLAFLTNGRLALDYTDDGRTHGPVHGGGKIGFRQMGLTAPCYYDNFTVYELKPDANPPASRQP